MRSGKKIFVSLFLSSVLLFSAAAESEVNTSPLAVGADLIVSKSIGTYENIVNYGVGAGLKFEYTLPVILEKDTMGLSAMVFYKSMGFGSDVPYSSFEDFGGFLGFFYNAKCNSVFSFQPELFGGFALQKMTTKDDASIQGCYFDPVVGLKLGFRMTVSKYMDISITPEFNLLLEKNTLQSQAGASVGFMWRIPAVKKNPSAEASQAAEEVTEDFDEVTVVLEDE